MKKKIKRAMCCLVATLLLSQSAAFSYISGCCPAVVVAAEKKTLKDYVKDFWTDTKTAFGWFGDVVVGSYDVVGQALSETANDMQTNFKNAVNNRFAGLEYHFSDGTTLKYDNPDKVDGVGDWIVIKENEDGTATVEDAAMDFFYGFIEEHKKYYVVKSAYSSAEDFLSHYYKLPDYSADWISKTYAFMRKYTKFCYNNDVKEDFYTQIVGLNPVKYFYADGGDITKIYYLADDMTQGKYRYMDPSLRYDDIEDPYAYCNYPLKFLTKTYYGENLVVWKSKAYLVSYVNGGVSISNNNTYVNYDKTVDNSVTTNIKNIYGHDWKKVSDDLEQTINNALSENSYDDAALMELIQSETDKLVQVIEDSAGETTEAVEENTGILEKILKELKAIKTAIIGFGVVDTIKDMIDDGTDTVENIVDSVADAFSDVGETATERFPFSIPWDLAALVKCFAAEPAVPKFDIPIKLDKYSIDETVTVSLSAFAFLSKISRGMLTIIFLVGLLWITFHMTGGGDD